MEEALVSVVVPIYKVEKYLSSCIESIINQTYKKIEIILVDDGSPDSCPRICDSYADLDSRIVVIHKKNGGLSDARNVGIGKSTGEYITFVDSDDRLEAEFIELLLNLILKTNSDIAFCDYQNINEESNIIGYSKTKNSILCFSNFECLKNMYQPRFHGIEFVTWGKLYKTQLFKKNNIEFPYGKIHEDTFTTYKLCYYSKKTVFTERCLYCYRIRPGSIMTSSFNVKHVDKLEAGLEACDFFESKNEQKMLDLAFNDFLYSNVSLYLDLCRSKKKVDFSAAKNKMMAIYKAGIQRYMKKTSIKLYKKFIYRLFQTIPCEFLALIVCIRK